MYRTSLPSLRCVGNVSLTALLAAGSLLLASIPAAQADVLYDNGAPLGVEGREITEGFTIADDFTLSSAATLDSFTFWNIEFPFGGGLSSTLNYGVYADNAGALGSLITSGTTTSATLAHNATGVTAQGFFPEYQNDVTISPIGLSAGTYWLTVSDPSGSFAYWETTNPNGSYSALQDNNGGGYGSLGTQQAFRINGIVPEGSTAMLLSLALPMIGAVVIRRRKN